MASRKAISVKIATAKVIAALEAALTKLESDYANQKDNEAKHDKAVEKYNKELAKLALANISKATDVSARVGWQGHTTVSFSLPKGLVDFPDEPVRGFEVIHTHTYKEMKQELENAIRILKMTDEEVVNTSTYNAISRFL